jgi:pantoate--beta-alanine ligase
VNVLESVEAVRAACDRYRVAGLSVGLVPTLGALHEGHISLFRRARAECDRVVVSIFVNPTQFGPGEDFAAYPRPRDADLAACAAAGVDLTFLAREGEMYPGGFQTWVTVERLSQPLCGQSRKVHFRGVATVVAQLLAIVRPHRAYFGAKDYQQTRVVTRLALDLHLGVEVRVCETVREADGLALSSRNAYLSARERAEAPRLQAALIAGRELVLGGERRVAAVLSRLRSDLERIPDLLLDYVELRDAETLDELPGGTIDGRRPLVLAIAAFLGKTRLIDNVVISIPGSSP